MPSPFVETDVPTNSLATTGESGASKSCLMLLTNVLCQSPVTKTALRTSRATTWSSSRLRAAGKPSQASFHRRSPAAPSWSSRAIITLLPNAFHRAPEDSPAYSHSSCAVPSMVIAGSYAASQACASPQPHGGTERYCRPSMMSSWSRVPKASRR